MTKDFKVFIGNIPFDCRESDIHSFFKGYGRIRQVVLKNNYGFCDFLEYEDARAAVKELNGGRLLGARVTVEMARGEFFRQDVSSGDDLSWQEEEGTCVYLGGLPPNCTQTDIDIFFNGYGRLNLVIMRKQHSFAFIEEDRDAREAVKELQGRKIRGEEVLLELLEKDEDNCVRFPQYRLKVENLSQNTGSRELRDIMKAAGELLYCEVHQEVRGEGVVQFSRWRDLLWALKHLHLTKISEKC